ncbi:fructosamine-3-kinase [Cricetibacter osteomyelitidis]|uniref:Fructosamine-3-kinase n=1 Tax=Cricetibacter osteomyelitidis TaxID=1521931 RepID=A0A4R2T2F7_9PAST|nr:fructosamine kinase family protein [Cricetibacter osteomyelitidis]TCP95356.1 fructosamine-3-kinase [Cricetibacter osteomyelitidis]
MWKSISQVLADQFGAYYSIKSKTQIQSGENHEAWIIDDGIQPVFVKINEKSYRSLFRAEADQLELLAKSNTVTVPLVYGVGVSQSHSFLLLESLPMTDYKQGDMAEFGRSIAKLHRWANQDKYGLDFDTWLGRVHQPNEWQSNWSTFFSEKRIGWQLQLCKEKGIEFCDIAQIVHAVTKQLTKHNPRPSLLHGNLWSENCSTVNGNIVTYDPACYWGDHECDLAFSELFEPFPIEFYQGYQEIYAIENGYEDRKLIYQLYYLLNFCHRFKGQYIELTKARIKEILQ